MEELNIFFFLFTVMALIYGKVLGIWKSNRGAEYAIGASSIMGGSISLFCVRVPLFVSLMEAVIIICIMYAFIATMHKKEHQGNSKTIKG